MCERFWTLPFGWSCTIENTSALDIQIAETLGLKPVGQDTKQEMARQVRGRRRRNTLCKRVRSCSNIEIAQARDLDVECTPIRQRRPTFTRGISVRPRGASIACRLA